MENLATPDVNELVKNLSNEERAKVIKALKETENLVSEPVRMVNFKIKVPYATVPTRTVSEVWIE